MKDDKKYCEYCGIELIRKDESSEYEHPEKKEIELRCCIELGRDECPTRRDIPFRKECKIIFRQDELLFLDKKHDNREGENKKHFDYIEDLAIEMTKAIIDQIRLECKERSILL